MKVFNLGKTRKRYSWKDAEETSELSEYDINKISKEGFDAVFYWYIEGCYEGSGAMIATKDGKWWFFDISHCSCYGPSENVSIDDNCYDLDKILVLGTKEWSDDYIDLVELAKKEGFK